MCMHSGLRGWNMSSISILACLQVICTCWLVLGLRVLESNLLMRNGSVMMVTAICLLHALTCTHNTNKCSCTLYLRTPAPILPQHLHTHTYVPTYIPTYIRTPAHTQRTHVHQVIKNDGGALCNQYPSDIIIIKHEKTLPDTLMIRE